MPAIGLRLGLMFTYPIGSVGGISTTVYSDDFSSGGYSGGTGWSGPWVDEETNATTASAGNIRVEAGAMRLYQAISGAGGIYRAFTVSASDITEHVLSFSFRGNTGNDVGLDVLKVEISSNGGVSYDDVATLYSNSASYGISTHQLTSITGPGTYRLRFRVESATQTSEDYYVDNVSVTVTGTS